MSLQMVLKSMTLNSVMDVTLRYFTKFGKPAFQLLTTCLGFAHPDIRYPDLSVNFMAAKNPDILK